MVMLVVVTVAAPELNVSNVPVVPDTLVTVAETVAAGLYANPAGALKTIAPVPTSLLAPSVSTGPVNVV